MTNKRVLIITYYWPPAGGAGVQRWLKFCKYLGDFGWEPIVYTADGGEIPAFDKSLEKEIPANLKVLQHPIWEPYSFYKKFTGRKKDDKIYSGFLNEQKRNSFAQNVSIFLRGNFFIPDARMCWIKPSVKFLVSFLKQQKVDAIISTGPPHSMHRIGLKLHRLTEIPWVADFRDPWTNIDYHGKLKLTPLAAWRHRKMELEVLSEADKVVTVSWSWANDFEEISGRKDLVVIPNGFDSADFQLDYRVNLDEKFTLSHIGSMNGDRNPSALWEAIADVCKQKSDFQKDFVLRLVGNVDFTVRQSIHRFGLERFLDARPFIPHSEAVKMIQQSQILLLPINDVASSNGRLPLKLFEYLAAKRPILAIGNPQQDAGKVLRETQAGHIFSYDDMNGIRSAIEDWYYQYKKGVLNINSKNIDGYSRSNLASQYAALLSSLVSQRSKRTHA